MRIDLERRLQLLRVVLLWAVSCVPFTAVAQTPPQAPAQAPPTEQTQPAATSPGTGQAPPATTPPASAEGQTPPLQGQPPAQAQPSQQPQPSGQPQPAQKGPNAGAKAGSTGAAKGEGSKAESSKPEGATSEAGKPEAATSEGARPEASKAEGTKGEGAKSEGAKPAPAVSEGARAEGAKAQGRAGQSEAGQGAGAQPRRTRPAGEANSQQSTTRQGDRPAAGGQPGTTAGAVPGAADAGAARSGQVRPAAPRQPAPPFSFAFVERLAQDRSTKPYRNRSTKLPDAVSKLTYEQYRDIRFQRTSSLWYDRALFEVQFFHRGFNFDRRVNISEVSGGVARPVLYNPAMFDFGPRVPKIEFPPDLGFAGFRIHYPLNSPAYKDELIVFLGASYFRVLGRNQVYGLSARGLAIDTGATSGEEFPYFTDFWLVKPEPTARTLTVYALLDSPGITGAYQFEIRPGTTTQVQVTSELYPRRQIAKLGIAPLTSMFLYGENSGTRRFDDYRPEVHDSDGLMTERGTGEWMWRPLVNPKDLRVNRFMDERPRSFALVQRDRDFNHYQDDEARYERRPSYRVEPLGDWGKGGVELVEIPSDEEIHDNIVSYWVPDAPVQPGKPMTFSYLLSAYTGTTQWPPGGKVIATHFSRVVSGASVVPGVRRVIVDFAGGDLDSLAGAQPVQAQASASGGEIDEVTVERLAANGVWRVSMRMKTSDKPVDLRCYLTLYGEALTETWTYLWAPGN